MIQDEKFPVTEAATVEECNLLPKMCTSVSFEKVAQGKKDTLRNLTRGFFNKRKEESQNITKNRIENTPETKFTARLIIKFSKVPNLSWVNIFLNSIKPHFTPPLKNPAQSHPFPVLSFALATNSLF